MSRKLMTMLTVAGAVALAAQDVRAQTTGGITGNVQDATNGTAVKDAVVIAQSPNLQGEQTSVTDDKGEFEISSLPPGEYQLIVQAPGFQPFTQGGLNIHLDKTLRVRLSVVPEAMQGQEVTVTARAPVIDEGSTTSGVTVGQKQMQLVPYGRGSRNFDAVATVAPGVYGDRFGAQVQGSTSPENNYIIDGVNVTNPGFGTLGTSLLQDFVQEVEIKTGGYLPEYGRATGGIINVTTKSGGNEFHGSVFLNASPPGFSAAQKTVFRYGATTAESIGSALQQNYVLDAGAELGGYIIKDKLWFYVGFAPQVSDLKRDRTFTCPGCNADGSNQTFANDTKTYHSTTTSYQFAGKLTFLANENHSFAVSAYGNPTNSGQAGQFSVDPTGGVRSFNGAESTFLSNYSYGSEDVGLRYTGKLLNKQMLVEAFLNWHHQEDQETPIAVNGETPGQLDSTYGYRWDPSTSLGLFAPGGGALPNGVTPGSFGGGDPSLPGDFLAACQMHPGACTAARFRLGGLGFLDHAIYNRVGAVLKATNFVNFLGHHAIKYGIDFEQDTFDHDKHYTGGAFVRYRPAAGGYLDFFRQYGEADPNHPGQATIDSHLHNTTASTDTALFLQDSWSVLDKVSVNFGVRADIFKMYGADPATGATSSTPALNLPVSVAPRVGVIYDWTGRGTSKVYASYGQFFEQVPLDLADRQFPSEKQASERRDPTKCTTPGDANTCAQIHNAYGPGRDFSFIGAGATPVDPNLKDQFISEELVGAQYQVYQDVAVGVEYAHRSLDRVIEDMSADDGNTYFISNPGVPGDLGYSATTGQGQTILEPPPVRLYDGVTLFVNKAFSDNFFVQASYTYSSLRGNYPGLFSDTNGQLDPNILSEYDLVSLLGNKTGNLPGDKPQAFKLDAAYQFDISQALSLSLGGSFHVASGSPINYLGAHPLYGPNEAWVLPRGIGGRTPALSNLDVMLSGNYKISKDYGVAVTLSVFNALNSQNETSTDQEWTADPILPIIGGSAPGTTPAYTTCGGDPKCVPNNKPSGDLVYLRQTDGTPATVNPNWGNATSYQAPISFKLGAKLIF